MKIKDTRFVPAVLGAVVLLAGCSGGQAPSASGLPTTGMSPQNQNQQGNGGGCQEGNIRIRPSCKITFDSGNPGPIDVTIGRQGNKTRVKERDDCAAGGIAIVTRNDNRHFTVTAGSTTGSCSAHFTDGGGQGNGGKLKVVNAL